MSLMAVLKGLTLIKADKALFIPLPVIFSKRHLLQLLPASEETVAYGSWNEIPVGISSLLDSLFYNRVRILTAFRE